MKRIKSIILIIMLLIPIFIKAAGPASYTNGYSQAYGYMNKENFKVTRERYIANTSESHFISKDEYELTLSSNGRSYLFDGVEYWTATGSNNKHFIVNHKGQAQEVSDENTYSVRDVEVVVNSDNVTVRGSGSYANPWTFEPMYEVKVKVDLKYGYIREKSLNRNSESLYIVRGGEASLPMGAQAGYKYITNDCDADYSNGTLEISNVKRNMVCNVVFGSGKFKVSLSGATPPEIYVNFRENFYKEEECINTISSVTPPTKTGNIFKGYELEDGTLVVNEDGTINRSASEKIMEPVSLNPKWEGRQYTVAFNANGGSGGQSASVTAIYGQDMPTISTTKPTKSGFTFMGWYDNATYTSGTQYYKADGTSARTYNKAGNTTLYAGWKDATPPTCNITFNSSTATLTYSDNSGSVSAYDLTKSSTATYNNSSSLAIGTGTFYGYVKDATGNTGTCSRTVSKTSIKDYTRTYQYCKITNTTYSCPSGCTKSGSGSGTKCSKTTTTTSYTYGTWYYNDVSSCRSACAKTCSAQVDGQTQQNTGKYICHYHCPSGYTLSSGSCKTTTSCAVNKSYTYGWGSNEYDYPTSCSTSSPSCNSTSVWRTTNCSVRSYQCPSGYTSVASTPTASSYCYK